MLWIRGIAYVLSGRPVGGKGGRPSVLGSSKPVTEVSILPTCGTPRYVYRVVVAVMNLGMEKIVEVGDGGETASHWWKADSEGKEAERKDLSGWRGSWT